MKWGPSLHRLVHCMNGYHVVGVEFPRRSRSLIIHLVGFAIMAGHEIFAG